MNFSLTWNECKEPRTIRVRGIHIIVVLGIYFQPFIKKWCGWALESRKVYKNTKMDNKYWCTIWGVTMHISLGYLSYTIPGNCSYIDYYWLVWFIVLMPLSQYFSYIVAVRFIGGGNRSTLRKPLTCRKSLTNFIT